MEADRVMCMQFVVSFAFFSPFGGSVGGGVIFRADLTALKTVAEQLHVTEGCAVPYPACAETRPPAQQLLKAKPKQAHATALCSA